MSLQPSPFSDDFISGLNDLSSRLPESLHKSLWQFVDCLFGLDHPAAQEAMPLVATRILQLGQAAADLLAAQPTRQAEPAQESEKINLLKALSFFQGIDPIDLRDMAQVMEERQYPAGSNIMAQGEAAKAVYFIKAGQVEILVGGELVAHRKAGDSIGEMSCLRGEREASATVRAATEAWIWEVDRELFLQVVDRLPRLWRNVFREMTNRFQQASQRKSDLLQHAEEGLMLLNPQGEITEEYSLKCTQYLGLPQLAGQNFAELVLQDSKQREQWNKVFPLFFEGNMIGFSSLTTLLPQEISFTTAEGVTRIFKLGYYPCRGAKNRLSGVDVGLHDISAERDQAKKRARLEAERLSQQKIYQDPDAYLQMLSLAAHLSQELGALGRKAGQLQVEPGLLRRLHSLKGLCGLFLLDGAKTSTHRLEGLLMPLLDTPGNLPQPELRHGLKEFEQEVQQAKKLLDSLGEEMKLRLTGKVLSTDDFLDLKLMVQDQDQAGLEALIRRLEAQHARKLVELWPDEIDRLSRLLHKKVKFRLTGGGIELPMELCKELSPLLLHLLRNALDHGIEDPATRKALGKEEFGIITVAFDKKGQNLEMIIADDGQGIDLARIIAKARSKTHLDQEQVEALANSAEPWRILALPGFSMRERANEVSGRGVGLNAIDEFLLQMGGRLDLQSEPGQGTRFIVTIPLDGEFRHP